MTIRTRMTLGYLGVIFLSLGIMTAVLYFELVYEPRVEKGTPKAETVLEQIVDIVFLYSVPTFLAILFLGRVFLQRTLDPVTDLTKAAEVVTAGQLSNRLPGTGNGDELDRLTDVLNGMLARLDESFQRVRQFTVRASHELKTPLTLLRSEVESIARGDYKPEEREEVFGNLLDEIQRLARMVDALALLTKTGDGAEEFVFESVPLHVLIREISEDANVLATEQGLTSQLGECDEVEIRGDRGRLRQLLLNLIENAVKHNVLGGTIKIGLRAMEARAVVEISNTSPAGGEDFGDRVFEPFFRGKTALKGRIEGSGLGLSIARWIVE